MIRQSLSFAQMLMQNTCKLEEPTSTVYAGCRSARVQKHSKKVVGRCDADSESWRSILGGAEEMQRCYNVSDLLSTLISTQRKKKKKTRGELGQRDGEEDGVGGTPNDRYDHTYSGGNISEK